MSKRTEIGIIFVVLLALVFTFYLGLTLPKKAFATYNIPKQQLNLFTQVFSIIQSQYVEKEPSSKLIIKAIKGMVSALDPHSEFLTPQEYKNMQISMKGHFGGLGVVIDKKNGFLTVVSVLPQTPASKIGIKPKDTILKVNNISTYGMGLEKIVQILRGKPGTFVRLTILRENSPKPLVFKIKREIIHLENVISKDINGIGYIQIVQFRDNTAKDVKKALVSLEKKHIKGLILDLRDNPGGLLSQAAKVSDLFVNKGVVVSIRGRNQDNDQVIYARDDSIFRKPIVVLINSGTASAAEIVTGCLQDHQRAVVIGQRSFGKGNVQDVIPINDYALILTVAKYYTPNGHSIQAIGITPNIEIKKPSQDNFTLREDNLLHHLTSKESIPQKPNLVLIDKDKTPKKHLNDQFDVKVALKVLDVEALKCPNSATVCYTY